MMDWPYFIGSGIGIALVFGAFGFADWYCSKFFRE